MKMTAQTSSTPACTATNLLRVAFLSSRVKTTCTVKHPASNADALRACGSTQPWASSSSEDVRHYLRRGTEAAASGRAGQCQRTRSPQVRRCPAIPIASVTRPHRELIRRPRTAGCCLILPTTGGRWAMAQANGAPRGSGRKLRRRVGVRTATHPDPSSKEDASCHLRLRRGP